MHKRALHLKLSQNMINIWKHTVRVCLAMEHKLTPEQFATFMNAQNGLMKFLAKEEIDVEAIIDSIKSTVISLNNT